MQGVKQAQCRDYRRTNRLIWEDECDSWSAVHLGSNISDFDRFNT